MELISRSASIFNIGLFGGLVFKHPLVCGCPIAIFYSNLRFIFLTLDFDSFPFPSLVSPRLLNKSQAMRIGSVLTSSASERPLKAVSTSARTDIVIASGFGDGWLNKNARMAARLFFSVHRSKGDLGSL